jgi:hypothetical protein
MAPSEADRLTAGHSDYLRVDLGRIDARVTE